MNTFTPDNKHLKHLKRLIKWAGLPISNDHTDNEITHPRADGLLVVGYTTYDQNPDDPQEWGSVGKILTASTRYSNYNLAAMFEACGLDSDGGIPDQYYQTPSGRWRSDEDGRKASRRDFQRHKIGNRDAVLLDVYEHGLCRYSVSGSLDTEGWDTAHGGGMWLPTPDQRTDLEAEGRKRGNLARHKLARKFAEGDCDVMTAYYNGDVHGYVASLLELWVGKDGTLRGAHEIDNDSCWGFYADDEYLESQLLEAVRALAESDVDPESAERIQSPTIKETTTHAHA